MSTEIWLWFIPTLTFIWGLIIGALATYYYFSFLNE